MPWKQILMNKLDKIVCSLIDKTLSEYLYGTVVQDPL